MAMLTHESTVPMIVSPRGMLEPWALAHRRMKKTIAWHLWQKRVLQSAALLHATSAQEAASIRAVGLQNPIAIVPNGVGIPTLTEAALAPSHRARGESRRCIYLSRIHEKKGLPLLLRAWSALRPPGWTLDIAGFGEETYVAAIMNLIRELDCPSIQFVGEKSGDAKVEFLKGAHLFVLPSYSENFGVAVAEAMAHGIPVIATHGTPWSVLDDNRLGWWVPATTEAIYDALKQATCLAPDELHDMGYRARHYAADAFSWTGVARSMAACYNWVCRGGAPPYPILLDGMRIVT
jgi:glycosyltransferase involved in cell wall biosynthesis